MDRIVFISLQVEDLQAIIKDCVNFCLKSHQHKESQAESDQWLDLNQLCDYLPDKPAKATAYLWVRQRTIPSHKKGKKLFLLRSEVDAYLKAGRRKTTVETEAAADRFLSNQAKKGGEL